MTMQNSIALAEILDATRGTLRYGEEGAALSLKVTTDTRALEKGDIFVALRGENFDAHHFLHEAAQRGAALLLCETNPVEQTSSWPSHTAVIEVADTLQALQDLARYWRTQLTDRAVGITGSNGKTSTKDLAAAVLRQRYETEATFGNLNNHIGLPLTVLKNTRVTEVSLYEMGMNHAGEIAPLCAICAPQVGIITSIGTAHIEHLGSEEAIAREKGALAAALPAYGTLIIPADLSHRTLIAEMSEAKLLTVSLDGTGDLNASEIHSNQESETGKSGTSFLLHLPTGETAPVILPLQGRHMVSNALLAAAAGHLYGLSAAEIAAGLSSAALTSGRLRQYSSGGRTIIDDTYNANPDSMKAAAETLAQSLQDGVPGYLILGKMGELGALTDASHLEVGAYAAQRGLHLISVGKGAQLLTQGAAAHGAPTARHFDNNIDAAQWLNDHLPPCATLLFKGSRTARMETLMHALFPEEKRDLLTS